MNEARESTEAQRLEAARLYAQWHLGYSEWADQILSAHSNPTRTLERLADAGMKRARAALSRES